MELKEIKLEIADIKLILNRSEGMRWYEVEYSDFEVHNTVTVKQVYTSIDEVKEEINIYFAKSTYSLIKNEE